MTNVVIVDAVRTPVGRRNGGLSTVHPAELLGHRPEGDRRAHRHRPGRGRPGRRRLRQPGRRAELQRHPHRVAGRRPAAERRRPPRSTPSAARASRPPTWPSRSSASGVVDVALACGVEVDEPHPDRRPARSKDARPRHPDPEDLLRPLRDDLAVRGRRAHRRQVGRHPRRHRRASGSRRQERAARAWAEDRFAGQFVPVEAPDLDEDGKPTGTTHTVARDEGLRETTLEKLADAQAGRPRRRRAHRRQLVADLRRRRGGAADDRGEGRASSASRPRARIVDTCLVGVDPVLMLTGPIDATQRLLERTGLSIDDIDAVRDQRGVRLGRAGVGQGGRRRPRARPTPTAGRSPSATRSAAPARS